MSHPSGPNTIVLNESGNCKRCQCGPPQFDVHAATNDRRLIDFLGEEEVTTKINKLNEIFPKKQASPLVFLWMIPFLVGGIICLGSLRGNSFTCTKVTTICNATATNPDLATCNRAWCCEGDNYEDWYENGFPDASGFQKKGCVAKGPDESIVDKQDKQDKSHLYSEYCKKKERIPGCNCHIEIDTKGRRELKCHDSIFLEGKPDNYSWERSNFFPLFIIAMIAVQGGWIVPFTFFLVKQCRACKFLTNEYFKDWQAQGIGVTYIAPGKHNSGSLGLVVPANNGGRPQQGQRVIMAEVVTVSGSLSGAQVLPTK